jgi:CheY-like chemotaxis protein
MDAAKTVCADCSMLRDILPGVGLADVLRSLSEVMVAVLNEDRQVLWANNAFASYFSRSGQDCIGEYCYFLLKDDGFQKWVCAGGAPGSSFLFTDERSRRTVQCGLKSLDVGSGDCNTVLTLSDVTDLSECREDIEISREREQYAWSINDQMVLQVDSTVRTSLMSLVGLVEFLDDTDLNLEQSGYIDGMRGALDRLEAVVNDFVCESRKQMQLEAYPEVGTRISSPVVDQVKSLCESSSKAHILLVEDNMVHVKVVQRMLAEAGVKVDSVGNGADALVQVGSDPGRYSLIIMDCDLPEMDGYEATQRLRESGCEIPIIALSAHADSDSRKRCAAAGMDAFLSKPPRKEEIFRVVTAKIG